MEKGVSSEAELPKAIVRRIVKDKLCRSSESSDIILHKDSLLAFSESARIFIHYLSATANDICKDAKRQTISADDVFKALEEIDFPEFIDPLKASLDEFRKKNAGKRKGGSQVKEVKKKKGELEEEPLAENGSGESKQDENDEHEVELEAETEAEAEEAE